MRQVSDMRVEIAGNYLLPHIAALKIRLF